jgi:curved DNA-binding protein CbpA
LSRVQPDHYLALGLTPDASQAEVRAAYLRVMRDSHPDRRPGDTTAARRARTANAAWEVLGDAARRGTYDRLQGRGSDVKIVRSGADEARIAAYREQVTAFSRQFQSAALRTGFVVCLLGLVLLAGAAA